MPAEIISAEKTYNAKKIKAEKEQKQKKTKACYTVTSSIINIDIVFFIFKNI